MDPCPQSECAPRQPLGGRPILFVAIAVTVYTLVLVWACLAKFRAYDYRDFDLAIDAQSVWNLLHGSLQSSILGVPFLGNHMRLILFLVAPLYALWPSPHLLLLLQTLVLASGAVAVFLLARTEIPDKWAAALSVLYAVYPPLLYLNLYEFHPIALAAGFLLWSLYFYRASRFAWFCVFLALAMLCQENVALIAAGMGVYAACDRRRGRWIWVPFLAGVVCFVVTVAVVLPRLNPAIQFMRLYDHLGRGPSDMASNLVRHPFAALAGALTPSKLAFLAALFSPLAFVSFLGPLGLLAALPVFAQRLLSSRLSESSIAYHYQAEFIPFVFFAAVYGIRRLLSWNVRSVRPALAIVLAAAAAIALAASGVGPEFARIARLRRAAGYRIGVRDRVLASIPARAPVLATFEFLPKLANRAGLYSFHHVYSGAYTLSCVPYPTPAVEYVVMDSLDDLTFTRRGFYGPENYRRIRAILDEPGWELACHAETLLVFRRVPGSDARLPPLAATVPSASPAQQNIVCEGADRAGIEPVGFTVGPADTNGLAALTLYWRKTAQPAPECNVVLVLIGKDRPIYTGVLAPGNRLWPPQSWPPGTITADQHRVPLFRPLSDPSSLRLFVRLFPVP